MKMSVKRADMGVDDQIVIEVEAQGKVGLVELDWEWVPANEIDDEEHYDPFGYFAVMIHSDLHITDAQVDRVEEFARAELRRIFPAHVMRGRPITYERK